eukprot:TRINITY_DN29860_c0_g1_i1.p1 TRINITY_DN29860_c0_g1~~TRINITY_DN29860_c0_g1_i1.p1  ORF type:complete len:240 (+),score=72.66 TRINITY_DN29860_c0_g1_i1:55-720(+)
MGATRESEMSDQVGADRLYKVLVVGDYAVGKTSIIKRYTTGEYSGHYRITIGVDFCTRTISHEGRNIAMQLWDVAGHERFGSMTRVYFKFAVAAAVVFDLTRPSTLESAKKWRSDINSKVALPNGEPVPMLLVANKCDKESAEATALKQTLDDFVLQNGFFGWMETSAATNTNIDQAFASILSEVTRLTRGLEITPIQQDAVPLSKNPQKRASGSGKRCCA